MRQGPLFTHVKTTGVYIDSKENATYSGIAFKTLLLLGLSVVIGIISAITMLSIDTPNTMMLYMMALSVAGVVGFVSVLVGIFSHKGVKLCSIIYACCQGLGLGATTCLVELALPGVAFIAVFTTVVIFATMFILFATGIIRNGSLIRKVSIAFLITALVLMLFTLISTLCVSGFDSLPMLILIELLLLAYGSFTLILNFQEAQFVVESGALKSEEWMIALGMLVSIIYIYIEALRLAVLIAANKD